MYIYVYVYVYGFVYIHIYVYIYTNCEVFFLEKSPSFVKLFCMQHLTVRVHQSRLVERARGKPTGDLFPPKNGDIKLLSPRTHGMREF